MPTSRAHFPFVYSSPPLRAHERIRPEGTDPRQYWLQFWRGLTYLRKYYSKSDRCPPQMEEHFAHHRAFLARGVHASASPDRESCRLGFVGDVMWLRDSWEEFLDPETREILAEYDGLFGNLETVVSPRFPITSWLPDLVRYNSPPRYLESFCARDGNPLFNAMSLANNHILDFGDDGALDTMASLDALGVSHNGIRQTAEKPRWSLTRFGPLQVGWLAATYGVNHAQDLERSELYLRTVPRLAPEGQGEPDLDSIREDLGAMRAAGVDLCVVSLHWGYEYEGYPTPRMMIIARELAAAGADVIVGSHAHVQQPLEVLFVNEPPASGAPELDDYLRITSMVKTDDGEPRRTLVAYSLGNFTTTMVTSRCKLAVVLGLTVARTSPTERWRWQSFDLCWLYNQGPFLRSGGNRRRLLPLQHALQATRSEQLRVDANRTREKIDFALS